MTARRSGRNGRVIMRKINTLASLVFAAGASAGLALSPLPALGAVFNAETATLSNGLQVVAIPNPRAPIVAHMVWYKVGSADETPGKSGIAHFTEHLMFKGTTEIAPGDFSKLVARNGGRDNAFTSFDYTGYYQNVARDRLELVMKMEADRMANLVLSDEVVLPERDVILEERRQVIDNRPQARLGEQLRAAQYLNHPYGRPIIGWEHEMRGLTTEDALAWYRRWYAPNNAVLIVAGDITMTELLPLAEKYYGAIPARPVPERLRPQEPPQQAARRVTLRDARVRVPSFQRSYIAPSYKSGETAHAYPLEILGEILGGGAGSRLHRSLVLDRQLASGAGSSYSGDALDLGTFALYASPRPGVSVETVEAAIDEELARLLKDGVTAEEVERSKTRMIEAAILARDSLQSGARAIGGAIAIGQTVADVEAWPERIAAVTVEQVTAAARAVLREEGSVTGLLLPKPSS